VYESAIPHEMKAEIIREHLNLIIKMFGKDAIKIIKELMENVDDKIKNILIRRVAIRRSLEGEAISVRLNEQFDNSELRLVTKLALEYRQRVRDWLYKLSPGEFPPERLSVKVRG
jgi:predicted ATP-dependent Lon-type protease